MKRIFIGILAVIHCLTLAGCGMEPVQTEPTAAKTPAAEPTVPVQPTETTAPTETTVPTETTAPIETTAPPETTVPSVPELEDSDFAAIRDYIPGIPVELKYATSENFTGHVIYEFQDVYLRYGTVKKLAAVQQELQTMGLGLKIWDGFRPVSAQFKLWEVCPDPTYVANPNKGYSNHSRGYAVDLTVVDASGAEIEMPTGFDDFSALADRDYSDCTETAAANAQMLQNIMEKHGFSGYFGEWWHFNDVVSYPVEEEFEPVAVSWWQADCEEFISLRTHPDASSETITQIPADEEFQVMAYHGDFALVDYQGWQGYVLRSYMKQK